MRKKIIIGNWKMNNNTDQSLKLTQDLIELLKGNSLKNTRIIIAPTFVSLSSIVSVVKDSMIEVAAQNVHHEEKGAFTGEVSAKMLKNINVNTVILGHSERRKYFQEDESLLTKKINTALSNSLEIVYCFGELLEERKKNTHFQVIEHQISKSLFHLNASDWSNIILAYEPVWAIGTGEMASSGENREMHTFIRQLIAKKYNDTLAQNTPILYGGSCNINNAKEFFLKSEVDGGLIGSASLIAEDFIKIIKSI